MSVIMSIPCLWRCGVLSTSTCYVTQVIKNQPFPGVVKLRPHVITCASSRVLSNLEQRIALDEALIASPELLCMKDGLFH